MTENRVPSETERAFFAACEALPDRASNSEIAALFMAIATGYRMDKGDLIVIFGAMLQAIGAGHYDQALADADADADEEDEA